MPDWDAIVLAGGRGSRLGGVDKAALTVGGRTLLDRVLAAVDGAARVVVVGDVERAGATVVRESPPFGGPAAAVGAALAEVGSAYVLLVGCDQPFVAEALDLLLTQVDGDGVIALDGSGRRQHLLTIVRTEALRESARRLGPLDGLSLRSLLAPLKLQEITVPDRSALDVDTWDDHDRATAEEEIHD